MEINIREYIAEDLEWKASGRKGCTVCKECRLRGNNPLDRQYIERSKGFI